jgi:hypothetical protein
VKKPEVARAKPSPADAKRGRDAGARDAETRDARARDARPDAGASAAPRRGGSPWLPTAAALLAIWCALFAPQLFRGQAFVIGDAIAFRPFPDFSRARWHERHERTFWNPYVFAGIPATVSLADSRPQYLPDVALDLYERLRDPFSRAVPMAAPLLAHLVGMLAMAGLARALWRVGPLGMIWAGGAWGLMPDLAVPLAFGHDAQCISASLTPVILLGIHHVVAAEDRRAWLAASLAIALAVGLMTLGGHPQIVVYAGMLAAGFTIERALTLRRVGRIAWLAGAAALGAAIGLAAWYPALLYSTHSSRGAADVGAALAEIAGYSLGPGDLASMAWPWAVGHSGAGYWGGLPSTEYPRYAGIIVLAACFVSWAGRRPGGSAAVFLAVATILGLIVSLGTNLGSVYRLLHEALPFWSRFRVPAAAQFVPQLGLALLSARLFAEPADGPVRHARGAGWIAAGAVAACALLAGLGLWRGPLDASYASAVLAARPSIPRAIALETAHRAGLDLIVRIAVLALAAALFRMRLSRRWRSAAATVLLPFVLAADLGSVVKPILARTTGSPQVLTSTPMPELARIGAAESHARVASARPPVANAPGRAGLDPQAEFLINDWIRWRARSLGGGHSAEPSVWRAGGELLRSVPALEALGVVYVSLPPAVNFDPALFEKVRETGDEVVCRLRGALGRLFAVPRVIATGNDIATVQLMTSGRFDPRAAALSTETDAAGDYPGSRACELRWIEDEPDRVSFDVETPDRAFVVLADTYFPGWTARVDDRPAPLHRVNQLTRGVAVPAGRHRVTMRYVPEGWTASVPVTRAAMLLWLAAAMALAAWGLRAAGGRGRATSV